MASSKDTLTIGWCDGGMVDGKFTQGLMYTILEAPKQGINVTQAVRVHGNQIGRQRQALFDGWADQLDTDWLLWVDSDIVLTIDLLKKLWEDVVFFRKLKAAGVPVYAHTGARAKHMKRFDFDDNYYALWWNNYKE